MRYVHHPNHNNKHARCGSDLLCSVFCSVFCLPAGDCNLLATTKSSREVLLILEFLMSDNSNNIWPRLRLSALLSLLFMMTKICIDQVDSTGLLLAIIIELVLNIYIKRSFSSSSLIFYLNICSRKYLSHVLDELPGLHLKLCRQTDRETRT